MNNNNSNNNSNNNNNNNTIRKGNKTSVHSPRLPLYCARTHHKSA